MGAVAGSVTLVLHTPSAPTVAVPIWLVTPLMVSNSVTVAAGRGFPDVTVPADGLGSRHWRCPAAVPMVTVGATVSSVNTTGLLVAGIAGGVGVPGHDRVRAVAGQRYTRAPRPALANASPCRSGS